MLKKTLATAVLVATMPAMAHAWQILTTARSTGGTLTTTANGSQAAAAGTKSKSYLDTNLVAQDISAAADAGFVLKSVTVTDLSIDANRKTVRTVTDVTSQLPYVLNPVAKHTYAVNAVFTVNAVAVTASNPNGIVSPARVNGLAAGSVLSKDLVFTFTPSKGFSVTGFTGVPTGATTSVPGGAGQAATVTLPAGFTVPGAIDLAALTTNVASVNPIVPVGGTVGASASITAASTGITSPVYAWTFVNGPAAAGALTGADTATVSFTPAAPGQYVFKVTETTSGTSQFAVVNASSVATNNSCQFCHTANGVADPTIGDRYAKSIHSQSTHSSCQACHFQGASHSGTVNNGSVTPGTFVVTADGVVNGSNTSAAKGTVFCASCHRNTQYGNYAPGHGIPFASAANPSLNGNACGACHASGANKDAHEIANVGCVGCHSLPKAAIAGLVNDNNGVRNIADEFGKWSHHVTGVALQDAHCVACHLEGDATVDGVVINESLHMADAKIHLRNADTDADLAWDPENPNFQTMDNFCLSCHDANGAVSPMSGTIQALINSKGFNAVGTTASALNPFGDTISNQYDKMARGRVVDAAGQFATTNNSHHAVLGKRYSGRTRVEGAARAVTSPTTFAGNSTSALPGKRMTIYEAGKFEATYRTLSPAPGTTDRTLGDDSVLHCGDCHTVGQFAARGTQAFRNLSTAYGAGISNFYKTAIGAHGSNNEYLLRNNAGTDAKHTGAEYNAAGLTFAAQDGTKPYLVCFNCHAMGTYQIGAKDSNLGHAKEYDYRDRCNGPSNTFGAYTTTGEARLESRLNYPGNVANNTFSSDFGNIFGIQCANCHNSGVSSDNFFGGIHGSKQQTYTDGMGNTSKHFRFMPGLGNVMFVPGTVGGFQGGTQAVFTAYSGNRNGTGTGKTVGQTFTAYPIRDGLVAKKGSYHYTTGAVSNDTNWEQISQTPSSALYNGGKLMPAESSAMGCYTLTPTGTQKYPAPAYTGDSRVAATDGITAQGAEIFGAWGGCDDHNGAQGAGTNILRKTLRPVSY